MRVGISRGEQVDLAITVEVSHGDRMGVSRRISHCGVERTLAIAEQNGDAVAGIIAREEIKMQGLLAHLSGAPAA